MQNTEELGKLLALNFIKGLGPRIIKSLVAYCGSVHDVFGSSLKSLKTVPGVGPQTASRIVNFQEWERVETELEFLSKHGIQTLMFYNNDYPSRLKELVDSPTMLFVKGNSTLNSGKMLGVVGSRKATNYGKSLVRELIADLAPYNPIIVSGLAYGIDIEAHKSALEHKLDTFGVLAHGLDTMYPSTHRNVAAQMTKNGGLITEFTSGVKLVKEMFPRRNRIVAGLVDGLLVVETTKKGGAMITANIAFSYNREVMAAPGRAVDEYSSGCNHLIKVNKASLIESARDVAWIMGWPSPGEEERKNTKLSQLKGEEKRIYEVLLQLPVDGLRFDQVQEEIQMSGPDLSLHLLNMEFNGDVESLPGNKYKIK